MRASAKIHEISVSVHRRASSVGYSGFDVFPGERHREPANQPTIQAASQRQRQTEIDGERQESGVNWVKNKKHVEVRKVIRNKVTKRFGDLAVSKTVETRTEKLNYSSIK